MRRFLPRKFRGSMTFDMFLSLFFLPFEGLVTMLGWGRVECGARPDPSIRAVI